MEDIKFYEINNDYIDYLVSCESRLFHNKQQGQVNERKYIGVVFQINEVEYFAPLSSLKPKHTNMKDGLDFIKVKNYAVINLNNMFPVPVGEYTYVDFAAIQDPQYRALLLAEYRYIKSIQDKIKKNAAALYSYKLANGEETPLGKRCNDFSALELACNKYKIEQSNKSPQVSSQIPVK